MYKFKLNNTVVKTPQNFDLIQFKKERSKTYGGFLQKGIALNVTDSITFSEPIAVQLLQTEYQRRGLSAIVKVEISNNNSVEYSGLIDFKSVNYDSNSFSCSFTDDESTLKLISSLNIQRAIKPLDKIELVNKPIANQITHSIPSELLYLRNKVKYSEGKQFNIPFKSTDSKTDAQNYTYQNNTSNTQRINIIGNLNGSFSGLGRFNIKAVANEEVILSSHNNTVTNELITIPIQYEMTLAPSQGFMINLDCPSPDFTINFDSSSYLEIVEVKKYENSFCGAIQLNDLFSDLIKASNSGLTYEKCHILDNWFITNGKNIRGLESDVNVSIEYLFTNLAKIFNLKFDVINGSKIVISEYLQSNGVSRLNPNKINKIVHFTDDTFAFNQIKHGFKSYSNEDKLGNFEPLSSRTYSSDVIGLNNTFQNETELIASNSIIEYIRTLQYKDNNTSSTSSKYDDSLFIIKCEYGSNDAFIQKPPRQFTNLSGLINKNEYCNLDILPSRTIHNFASVLYGHSRYLYFQSGTGNIQMNSKKVDELAIVNESDNISFNPSIYLSSEGIDISYNGSLLEYTNLRSVVSINNKGNSTLIFVNSAEYSPEDGQIVIIGTVIANR